MKNKMISAAAVLLSVLLLVAGWFFVTGGSTAGYLVPDDSLYCRAKVLWVQEHEGDFVGEEALDFTAQITLDGEKKTIDALWSYSSYASFNPLPIEVGDRVVVSSYDGGETWHYTEHVRSDALIVLLVIFFGALILFGRKKGLKTVVSLTLTVLAVVCVFIPAVMLGKNIYIWSVLVCVYITVMTLCIVNGTGPMSLAAIVGCSGGVLVSLLITVVTDLFMNLTGQTGDGAVYLLTINPHFDLVGLVYGSIIIGCVGAVMDVAVDISASLKELTLKMGGADAKTLFRSGLNIGRDVIGTMSNTLVLAYIGGSMSSVVLFIYNFGTAPVQLFNYESLVIEILCILVGSLGILFTLPLTSAVCAVVYTRPRALEKLRAEDGSDEKQIDEYTEALENISK